MIINSPQQLPNRKKDWYVFLAGPIQGGPDWQNNMPEIPNVIWLSPRRVSYENFNWEEQVDWETRCMKIADVILFWIPEKIEDIPGRDYGMTTRTEIGEYLAMGKKTIVAINSNYPGKRYLDFKARQYNSIAIVDTLDSAIDALTDFINTHRKQVFFASDTHFGSQRTLELSKRPFKNVIEMDWRLIERWNKIVMPGDDVYHLGDLGELWPLQYLNGNIHLRFGNYERDLISKDGSKYLEKLHEAGLIFGYENNQLFEDYVLAHEPITAKELLDKTPNAEFALFGHIHGRQKIKKFGIDVGIDANNYAPISLDDIKFYRNAIEKGYYDSEVWI